MPQTTALPLIADIKRHSLEDGPGIRSVVFFKGCPMRCVFCHNPEMQNPEIEIAFLVDKCMGCGNCAGVCPDEAIDMGFQERIHRDRCTRCGLCADACPGNALRSIGSPYATGELTDILLRDRPFYRHSGGGVTLSGGECTMFPGYLGVLLKSLKANEIHVTLETSGYFDIEIAERMILPYIDLVYYDIKFVDSQMHFKYTGKTNHRILQNFCRLVEQKNIEVQPRVPLVPGITDTRENLTSIVDFLWEAGARNLSLRPYNPMGIDTAVSLGFAKPDLPAEFPEADEQKELSAILKAVIAGKRKSNSIAVRP